jgi:hypothetical protein
MWGAFANRQQDDDHCEIVAKDDRSSLGPPQFNIVHSLRVSNDGMVYQCSPSAGTPAGKVRSLLQHDDRRRGRVPNAWHAAKGTNCPANIEA